MPMEYNKNNNNNNNENKKKHDARFDERREVTALTVIPSYRCTLAPKHLFNRQTPDMRLSV